MNWFVSITIVFIETIKDTFSVIIAVVAKMENALSKTWIP